MKKISLYTMALLSMGLVACNQDFDTEFVPQTNLQESPLQTSDVSVAASTATTINIADFIDEAAGTETAIPIATVTVKEGAMPANTILKAEVEFSKDADFANSIIVEANSLDGSNEISVQPSTLEDAYFNGITRNPATVDVYIRAILYTATGGNAVAVVGKPGENYYAQRTVKLTPLNKVQISPAYYVIGAAAGWSAEGARTQKFTHSDLDVYEDPFFSVIVDTGGDDCWFAIGDDTAIDAVAAGDWNQLFGTKGASEDLTGTMDRRYNLGGEHSFHITGAKKLRITLDMLEYSYTIEPINVADNYYLVGGPLDWGGSAASKEQKFSHSSASVADDPVFTYVLEGTGSEIWFAIGDDEACDAIANDGDWSKLYGTTAGDGNSGFSGSLARRSSLSDNGSFKVDGTAKYYRIQINMAELTYTITELNFDPYVYFIGATDGWAAAEQKLALTDESGIYTGFLYVADPNGWGMEFKFQKEAGNWDTQLNSNNLADITGGFAKGGDNIVAAGGEGVYYVTLDMANLTLDAVKVEKMGIIGDFNGWSSDVDMTWNAADYCYEATNPGVNANGWKFRINADWAINLGGDTLDDLVANGANLSAVGTTIKLYPTRKTSDKIFCTVE
ncbi:MAG: DUF5115 domain-containing protein [Prevotella sp.]|nr:DUF5115 domain-containing protein [Prevotella sp.]